jgi:hypothetical protein
VGGAPAWCGEGGRAQQRRIFKRHHARLHVVIIAVHVVAAISPLDFWSNNPSSSTGQQQQQLLLLQLAHRLVGPWSHQRLRGPLSINQVAGRGGREDGRLAASGRRSRSLTFFARPTDDVTQSGGRGCGRRRKAVGLLVQADLALEVRGEGGDT